MARGKYLIPLFQGLQTRHPQPASVCSSKPKLNSGCFREKGKHQDFHYLSQFTCTSLQVTEIWAADLVVTSLIHLSEYLMSVGVVVWYSGEP